MTLLKIVIAVGILTIGAAMIYIAMRLAMSDADVAHFGGPMGALDPTGLRLLKVPDKRQPIAVRTAEDAPRAVALSATPPPRGDDSKKRRRTGAPRQPTILAL